VEVREEREGDPIKTGGPDLVAVLGINADTQNLGVAGLKVALQRVETRDFSASCGGEIEGIEDEEHVLLARVVGELNRCVQVALQAESRRISAVCDEGHDLFGWGNGEENRPGSARTGNTLPSKGGCVSEKLSIY
jgi:hypothetical protein